MLRHLLEKTQAPKRVVILGGSGFLGKDLTEHLTATGVSVVTLSSKEVDLTTADAPEKLAAKVGKDDALVFASALTPDKGKDVATLVKNLTMAQGVAAFVEKSPPAHLIYVSSDAVYDGSLHLIRENSPCVPGDLYSCMHVSRELIMRAIADKAKVPCAIVRPCAVYGAGDTHNSYGPNRFFRTALKDKQVTLFGGGEEKRDHVHVRDVSRVIELCLNHRSEGVINVATGAATSFFDVATDVARLVGKDVRVHTTQRVSPITHRHFDNTALLKAFPELRLASLAEGLPMTYKA